MRIDNRFMVICLLLSLIAILACSVSSRSNPIPTSIPATKTPDPTPIPPAITGILDPWTEDTPIAGRHLTFCEFSGAEGSCNCTLMQSSITTDDQGSFEVQDVPSGKYMVMYDSGLSDFDEAMGRWGGTKLRLCDPDWLDEYFGVYAQGWAKIHVPKDIKLDPGTEMAYAQFSLGLGDSPFIIAHALGGTFSGTLELVTVDVKEGEPNEITVPVVYYGEK